MSLREAIRLSNVPIYQELARRAGLAPMGEQVARLDYGNRDIGTRVTALARWPAPDQRHGAGALFARLAEGSCPFPRRPVRRCGTSPAWSAWLDIARETGWWNAPCPGLGWWVGWVDRQAAASPLP